MMIFKRMVWRVKLQFDVDRERGGAGAGEAVQGGGLGYVWKWYSIICRMHIVRSCQMILVGGILSDRHLSPTTLRSETARPFWIPDGSA